MEAKPQKGRPKLAVKQDESIAVRVTPALRTALTEYRRRQSDLPSESETIRRVLEKELKKAGLL